MKHDDLDIDTLEPTELEAAKSVIDVQKKERKWETIRVAFINRIKETLEIGNTGYSRTVVFPIPLEAINEVDHVRSFIETVGVISRNPEMGLPVTMEEEEVEGIKMVSLVFEPTEDTNLERIREEFKK